MRVAYLVNQYPKTSHTFVRREILALESLGIQVDRFTIRRIDEPLPDAVDQAEEKLTTALLDSKTSLVQALVANAITRPVAFLAALGLTIQVGRKSDRGILRNFAYLAEACLLAKILKSRGISHVHSHFGTNSTTVAMLYQALSGGTYSFTVHGPEEFDGPRSLSLGEKIKRASFVIAISSFGRSQLYRWCGYSEWPKIHVVHCAVDSLFLDQDPEPIADIPQFVCVGRLCEQKGQMFLLQAAIELAKERKFELLFVGDGEFRDAMEKQIREHHLDESIRILGWKSSCEVRDLVHQCRVFVLPSFAEGLPVVIMEALALGRPVISTYVAGIPELVRPFESGWLVPAGSIAPLVDVMRTALDTPVDRLNEMGNTGRNAVRLEHCDTTEAEKLAKLFEETATA